MRSLFTAALNRPLNTLIDSDTITLSGIGTGVPFTLISGVGTSAYKNGANVTSTTVSDGDRIRIRVRSSTAYATPAFGVVKIGSEETIFSVVTQVDPTPILIESMSNVLPIDLVQYSDGQEYIPSHANNEINIYTNGILSKTVPIVEPSQSRPRVNDGTLVANYHSNQLFFLDSNLDVAAAIDLPEGSKPYGIAMTGTSDSNDLSLSWVTLSALDKIVALNTAYEIVAEYSTGIRPLGIASSADGVHVYVANYGSNTVTHFNYANGAWSRVTIPVGSKPFEIAIDAANNAWVSHVGEDKVYRISPSNVATAFTVASNALRGIVVDKTGHIWVAASKSNAILKLDSNGATVLTVPTGKHPYALSIASDGSIDVTCFIDSLVQSYATDGTKVRDHTTEKYPYGISTFGLFSVVANLYSNTPEYIITKDQTATQFALADITRIPKGSVYTSNSFKVAGITVGTSVVAAVPGDVFEAKLIKNGNTVGPNTTVVNGDTLALQFTAPNSFDTFVEIPLYVGNTFDLFTTRTEIEGVTPELFTFVNVLSANLNESYTSNTITIAGLSTGTTVPFSADGGKIVLNGVEQASLSIDVKNGDKIALRAASPVTEKSSVFITTLTGRIMTRADGSTTQQNKTVWRISTKAVTSEIWILPEFKGKSEYEPTFTASTDVAGKYITRLDSTNEKVLYPISNAPLPYDGNILIPSYHDGAVYQLNSETNLFQPIEDLNLNRRPVDIAANRYVAYTGIRNLIVDLVNGVEIALPSIPRRIAVGSTNDVLYVSLSDGTMAVVVREEGIARIRNVVQIGGSPYALAVSPTGIWISDLENKAVHFYRADDLQLSQTFSSGDGVWDMCVSDTHLWTANSYDNTVSKIDIVSGAIDTIKVESIPNHIEIDSDGNVCVSHYGSKTVIRLNAAMNARLSTTTLDYAPPAYMRRENEFLYIAEFHASQIEAQKKTSVMTPLKLAFESKADELINTRVQSNISKVEGLIRPTRISIEPDNNYDLYVNGVKSVTGSETVVLGDEIYLDVLTSSLYYTERIVTIIDFQSTVEFRVRTETNIKPEAVAFADLYDAIPGKTVESNAVVIRGMTPNHTTILHVSRIGWMISVNGSPPSAQVSVKNDDSIKIVGPVRGSYGTFTSYKLFAGKSNYLIGTFVVHNKDLDGPTMNFLDARNYISTLWISRTDKSVKTVEAILSSEIQSSGNLKAIEQFSFERQVTFPLRSAPSYDFEPQSAPNLKTIGQFEFQLERRHRSRGKIFDRMFIGGQINKFLEIEEKIFVRLPNTNQHTSEAPRAENGMPKIFHGFDSFESVKAVRSLRPVSEHIEPTLNTGGNAFKTVEREYVSGTGKSFVSTPILEFIKHENGLRTLDGVEFKTPERSLRMLVEPYYERGTRQDRLYFNREFECQPSHTQHSFSSDGAELPAKNSRHLSPTGSFELGSKLSHHVSDVNSFVAISKNSAVEVETTRFEVFRNRHVLSPAAQVQFIASPPPHAFDSGRPETLPNSLRTVSMHIVEKFTPNYWVIEKPLERTPQVIHVYTFEETASIEGAYASAVEAVAAGRAAGHAGAYPVMIDKDRFMWAVAIDSGDFCGVVNGPSLYPIPEKWYVHGG